jgi:endonuclease YncB( thermonuclease family)
MHGLSRMIEGATLMCALDETAPPPEPTATVRRVANCTAVRPGGEQFDVSRRMVEEGFAVGTNGNYDDEERQARALTRGLLTWCAIRPSAWRRMPQSAKDAFSERGVYAEGTPTMGTCPPPARRSFTPSGPVSAPD